MDIVITCMQQKVVLEEEQQRRNHMAVVSVFLLQFRHARLEGIIRPYLVFVNCNSNVQETQPGPELLPSMPPFGGGGGPHL